VFGLLCAEMLTRERQKATSARAFFVARGVSDSFIRSAAETLFRSSAEGFYLYTYTFRRKIGSATHNSMMMMIAFITFDEVVVLTGNWLKSRLLLEIVVIHNETFEQTNLLLDGQWDHTS